MGLKLSGRSLALLIAVGAALFARDRFAVRDQIGARAAGDDLAVDRGDVEDAGRHARTLRRTGAQGFALEARSNPAW